jgi:hypothetical protein
MKDVVCSKTGYKSKKVSLGIVENTVYDFVLTHKEETTRFVNFEGRFPLFNLLLQYFLTIKKISPISLFFLLN